MNKRVLLVGGCGFIGHNLAMHLKKKGCTIFIVDSLSVNNVLVSSPPWIGILTSLIINNLSLQFSALRNTQEAIFLSIFTLIFIVLLFLIGFLIEFVLEQTDSIKLDTYLEYACNIIFGMIKGFIFIAIILFTLETIPLSAQSKNTLYNKVEKNSLLLKPCYNFKDILFQN